jgi:Asp-tRNA(Asn)/Glu-tRNA(Gln) amidotransferase A subunit family amidase
LPIGCQIIGKPLDETLLLQTAFLLEAEKKLKKRPDMFA